jgi:hypothetical protein
MFASLFGKIEDDRQGRRGERGRLIMGRRRRQPRDRAEPNRQGRGPRLERTRVPVRLPSGVKPWMALDEGLAVVGVADAFLRHMRFGRDGSELTTTRTPGRLCCRTHRRSPFRGAPRLERR